MAKQEKPTGAAHLAQRGLINANREEPRLGVNKAVQQGVSGLISAPAQGAGALHPASQGLTGLINAGVGGGKLTRSETVTVRLDPKLRYLAELAARRQRRTVSSYIEWAIEESLNRVLICEGKSIADTAPTLWDVDEADRFAKLALNYPDLLTHGEQVLWKLIRENGYLFKGKYDSQGEWAWRASGDSLIMERLRENWDKFNAVARGEAEQSILPAWARKK